MAGTKDGLKGSTSGNISPEDLVAEEIISNEDVAESDIYGKTPEEASTEDNVFKDIQATEAKDEADAENKANEQLGPEVTGAKTELSQDSSSQAQQPTNVLERQEKAEEALGYAQPAISEIEEETVVAEELKRTNKAKKSKK